jgi:hypothetical protein
MKNNPAVRILTKYEVPKNPALRLIDLAIADPTWGKLLNSALKPKPQK